MQVGNLLHEWNVENDQACNKLPTSFQLVRLVGCGLNCSGSELLNLLPLGLQRCFFSNTVQYRMSFRSTSLLIYYNSKIAQHVVIALNS